MDIRIAHSEQRKHERITLLKVGDIYYFVSFYSTGYTSAQIPCDYTESVYPFHYVTY